MSTARSWTSAAARARRRSRPHPSLLRRLPGIPALSRRRRGARSAGQAVSPGRGLEHRRRPARRDRSRPALRPRVHRRARAGLQAGRNALPLPARAWRRGNDAPAALRPVPAHRHGRRQAARHHGRLDQPPPPAAGRRRPEARPRIPRPAAAPRAPAGEAGLAVHLRHVENARTKGTAMREAVVVASSRTPLAKSQRGSFNMTLPSDFTAHCITDVLGKVPQLDKKEVEDVILGCGQPHGAQGHNIARVAAMRAGLPTSVTGLTINRFCSSGLNAIAIAANYIVNEGADVVFGGGVESITMMQRDSSPNPWVKEKLPGIYMVMGDTAEVVAKRYKITRQQQDEYALSSQQRTARAQQEGFLKEELAPMHVTRGLLDKKTGEVVGKEEFYVEKDECNRPDTTLEGLMSLPPHFDKESGQGSVTAGNSSQLSDGASARLVMSMDRAKALGIRPKLVFRGFAVAGCEPDEMGIGPVFAVPKLLKRHGLKIDDIDVWELNEAFASQVVYCRDRLGIDPEKLNVNGGSISIGHPFGMTGSRMVGTLANEMLRRKAHYGIVPTSAGGGQGAAGLFEAYN